MNRMIKEWTNFVPQDLDKFVMSMYDFAESFEVETELAWFGIPDKWEVREEYRQHLPQVSHLLMKTDECQDSAKRASKICPDAGAYKECRAFRFPGKVASTNSSTSNQSNVTEPSFEVIAPLANHFSEQELYGMHGKATAALKNNHVRDGFKQRSYLVDSGRPLPYTVQCAKSGKCSCTCAQFQRNNLCHHCIAVATKTGNLNSLVANFKGRNLTSVATSSAPASVGSKMPPRKRQRTIEVMPSQQSDDEVLQPEQLTSESLGETTLLIRKNRKPEDPSPSAPLVLKPIAGGIRKCSGCQKPITADVVGFSSVDDKHFCFGRFEAYYYWNKNANSYKSTLSTRHYHLNPVCTKVHDGRAQIKVDQVRVTPTLRELLKDRFSLNV